jgi:hypothetical protein
LGRSKVDELKLLAISGLESRRRACPTLQLLAEVAEGRQQAHARRSARWRGIAAIINVKARLLGACLSPRERTDGHRKRTQM